MDTIETKRGVSFFNKLGPGLLLAATSIGASHLVMSPKPRSIRRCLRRKKAGHKRPAFLDLTK